MLFPGYYIKTSELIERAVNHYLLAKQSSSGDRDVTLLLQQTKVVLNVSVRCRPFKFNVQRKTTLF